jgi:hypothetical protein
VKVERSMSSAFIWIWLEPSFLVLNFENSLWNWNCQCIHSHWSDSVQFSGNVFFGKACIGMQEIFSKICEMQSLDCFESSHRALLLLLLQLEFGQNNAIKKALAAK